MISKQLLLQAVRQFRREGLCRRYYGTSVVRDVLSLHKRGIFKNIMPNTAAPDLAKKLSVSQPVYCGFDPTADSLHVGNLLAIIALIHFQRAGHQPIALIGGATAQIGDPSGKNKEREKIDAGVIENNVKGLMQNLERVFTNHAVYLWHDNRQLHDVKLLNNMSWYRDENVIQFLTNFGRYFRLTYMLRKESVQARLATAEGMSFTEFTYQIFQAYDWYHLLQKHQCYIQIGGNDQFGNISSGMEAIDKILKKRTFGLTIPLITTSSGEKFGKSEGNALWLDPKKTSPYQLYQYFYNIPDTEGEQFLKWFTFIPDGDIERICRDHKISPEKRKVQKILAEKVLLLVHGEQGLLEAQRWTEALWSNSPEPLLHLSDSDMQRLFDNAPTTDLIIQHDITVLDLVMKTKVFNREVDADRIIRAGGVYLNKIRVTEPDQVLTLGEHILPNNITLLRTGKKNYHIVRWISPT